MVLVLSFLQRPTLDQSITFGDLNAYPSSFCTTPVWHPALGHHGRHCFCLRARHHARTPLGACHAMAQKLPDHMARCLSDSNCCVAVGAKNCWAHDCLIPAPTNTLNATFLQQILRASRRDLCTIQSIGNTCDILPQRLCQHFALSIAGHNTGHFPASVGPDWATPSRIRAITRNDVRV